MTFRRRTKAIKEATAASKLQSRDDRAQNGVDVILISRRAWRFGEVNRDSALPHHPKRLCVVVQAGIVTVEPAGAYRAANLSTAIRDTLSTSTASDFQFLDQDIESHCVVRRKACRID